MHEMGMNKFFRKSLGNESDKYFAVHNTNTRNLKRQGNEGKQRSTSLIVISTVRHNASTSSAKSIPRAHARWAPILPGIREPLMSAFRWNPILPNTRDAARVGDRLLLWIPFPRETCVPIETIVTITLEDARSEILLS
jgi:hypothetical protein